MRKFIAVFCLLGFLGVLGEENSCLDESSNLIRWSQWNTRNAGELVEIPSGTNILFDVLDTPLFSGIHIYGSLVFEDSKDLHLQTEFIIVHDGGSLIIGTSCCPFTHKAIITLHTPNNLDDSHFGVGTKVIGVQPGGTLSMVGEIAAPTWTLLAETAEKGSDELLLIEDAQGWKTGDEIIVASTDFDPDQSEKHRISSISGRRITLAHPLQYSHFGQVSKGGVDTRGEVGLLTRNIVVKGDDNSANTKFGAHIMILAGFHLVHISGIEVVFGGQLGRVGRYPIHFHRAGDVSGRAFVKSCSIHENLQRALTIHGTSGLVVKRNVAYNTLGHTYFLEDGNEVNNTIAYNLAVLTKRINPEDRILPSDSEPASFWITNPDNTIVHNVAVGSDAFGFWYALPTHPTGPSADLPEAQDIWPRKTPLKKFAYNKAHSIAGDCLFVDRGPDENGVANGGAYAPVSDLSLSIFDFFANPQMGVEADFTASTYFKCANRGAWLAGGKLTISNSFFADCPIGVTFAIGSFEGLIRDSVFVGETNNRGEGVSPKSQDFPIRGFEFYDGPVSIKNCKFYDYIPNGIRNASAISMLRRDPFSIAPTNDAEQIQIMDASRTVQFPDFVHDGDKNSIFVDLDGSVTGRPPTNGMMAVVTNRDPFYLTKSCIVDTIGEVNICPHHFARLNVEIAGANWFDNTPYPVEIFKDDNPSVPRQICGSTCPRVDGAQPSAFGTTIMLRQSYTVHWNTSPPKTSRLRLSYADKYYDKDNDAFNYVIVGLCYAPGTLIEQVEYNFGTNPDPAESLEALKSNPYNREGNGLWYQDQNTGYIYFRVHPYEERNEDNNRQAWPLGLAGVTVSNPPPGIHRCTPHSSPQAEDPGLPPIGNVPQPPPFRPPPPPEARDEDICTGESLTGAISLPEEPTEGTSKQKNSGSLSGGAIAGIVISMLLVISFVSGVVVFVKYRDRFSKKMIFVEESTPQGAEMANSENSPRIESQNDWVTYYTEENVPYYYNMSTGETSWTLPDHYQTEDCVARANQNANFYLLKTFM